jgi:deoxyribodipyrimidine photo-lyase
MRTLVWFRGKDLRVADHAPLRDAAERGEVVPLFVLDPYFFAPERMAALPNRIAYLIDALAELREAIARLGSRLMLVEGRSVDVVPRLVREWKIDRVVAHRWCEPVGRERDRRIAEAVTVPFELFEGETLLPPGALRLYSVFTPFSHAFLKALEPTRPKPPPARLNPNPLRARSAELPAAPRPCPLPAGERAARDRLARFDPSRYALVRDRLDLAATSRLSADLHFGTISIREVWHRTHAHPAFANELIWREYAHAVLWHRPDALEQPLRPQWRGFPTRDDEPGWEAWATGHTGYPVVDAAARQLLGEGFVHNRARMISASFLSRHLAIDFRRGEAHYMKWLVDGDAANNDAGWQWSFGSGLDAQPYFRVFSPQRQGERFDPTGAYVDRWVPELRDVPLKYKHAPWLLPEALRPRAYPLPIVDHAFAKDRFIATAKRVTARRAPR